jgi:large subunit ribosomal protein L1
MKTKQETPKMAINDALEYVKKSCKAKFDSTIEVHINCAINKDKQESVRFSVTLPHGTGKSKKIVVMASQKITGADVELSEEDLQKIEKGQLKPKVDFDILLVEPRFMSKLAKMAKILGPAGLMPNPKNGTVTDDVQKTLEQFKKGRVEVRNEPNGAVIHTIIGKKSFTTQALTENYQELMSTLSANKPLKAQADWIKSVFISATMSPSVEIAI